MNSGDILWRYSIDDMCEFLIERDENYETVYWETLRDKVETALDEAEFEDLESLYLYIREHLL